MTTTCRKSLLRLVTPPSSNADPRDDSCILKAQKRVSRAYQRLGSFRKVGEKLGINQRWPSELMRGIVPHNPNIRHALGLPRKLPSERRSHVKKPIPTIGFPGWEEAFLKKRAPETKLARRLMEIRARAIAEGERLLDAEEIEQERQGRK